MSNTATKMTVFESITSEEYARRCEPVNGFIMAEKLLTPPKTQGGIILTDSTKTLSNRWKGAAVVLKKPKTKSEAAWDQYMTDLIEPGDVIGFGAATPILAPAPANLQFINDENQPDRTVVLHATDVILFYFDDEEKRKAWETRQEKAAQDYDRRRNGGY